MNQTDRKNGLRLLSALLLCNAAAAQAANLLPNGDFNTVNGITGWTFPGPVGSVLFVPTDANGSAISGSMEVFGTTVASSCFGVVAGASANFGGKASAASPSPDDQFPQDPTATMTCTAYTSLDCSGTALPMQALPLATQPEPAFAASAATGTVPTTAHSANCSIAVQSPPSGFFGSRGVLLDNLFFDSQHPASGVTLDGYLSGNWYNTEQSGHGFQLEFTDQGQTLVAIWYVYAPSGGAQKWIFAQGPYDLHGNSVTISAQLLDAPAFPPQFDPASVTRTPWGTLTFTFTDCDHGSVSWNSTVPGYGAGSMPLTRLTRIQGTACPQ